MKTAYQRLMHIVKRLYAGEKLKISMLAQDYGVSTKTIQRDLKEKLKSSLLIKKGHYFYLKNLDNQEDFVLDILSNIAKTMGDDFFLKTMQIFSKYQAVKDDVLFLELQSQLLTQKLDIIIILQSAIKKSLELHLLYKDSQLKSIQPYKISSINGDWFLFAKKNGETFFLCLKFIQKAKLTRRRFSPSKDILRRFESEFFKEPKTLVSLFIYPELASLFKQKKFASYQKNLEDNDGNLIIEFLSNNLLGIEQEILKNLPHIVVLEPQELKERIEEKVLNYAKKSQII